MFDKSTHSSSHSRGPRLSPSAPPPCQSNEVASGPWIRLNNHGSADTPRNRFDYSVELRQYQQKHEWFASQIKQSMFGDTESQNKVARKWVVDQWQRWGIWNKEWPEDGPGSQERWGNGLPACLLAMELAWEIEHVVTTRQPVDVSKICNTKAPQSPGSPPMNWSWDLVATLAAERLLNRHREDGFPSSKIELPSVVFRQDLKSLSVNLPEPVQKLVATVEKWDDLSLPPGTQTERRDIFGDPIGMYTKASTLEADGARDSDKEDGAPDSDNENEASDSDVDYGKGLFGISQREASTLEADGARNPGYETVRNCDNPEDLQRLFGIRHRKASTLEAGGAPSFGYETVRNCDNPEDLQRLFGIRPQEASTLEAGGAPSFGYETVRNCDNPEDLQRLFGIRPQEASTLEADGARDSDNEYGGGRYVIMQVESGQARKPGYRTVRKCVNREDLRRLLGISDEEASPLQEAVFLTESGRALFGMTGTFEAGGVQNADNEQVLPKVGGQVGNADDEETVRTSGRQVEGARNSGNEQVLPKVGGGRNSDLAEIAASIRAMRGSRRRERHRKPGERIVRQTQGGRVQKASKQARP